MAFVNRNNNYNQSKSIVLFAVFSIICFLLSSSVLPFFADSGNAPVPELLLCLVCVMPIYLDRKVSCIFALILGFLTDLFINEPVSFSPVVFVAAVLIVMVTGRYFSRPGTLSVSVCALPALAIRMIVDTVCYIARFSDSELFSVIIGKTLPHLIVNFASAIVITFIVGFFAKRFNIFALE